MVNPLAFTSITPTNGNHNPERHTGWAQGVHDITRPQNDQFGFNLEDQLIHMLSKSNQSPRNIANSQTQNCLSSEQ